MNRRQLIIVLTVMGLVSGLGAMGIMFTDSGVFSQMFGASPGSLVYYSNVNFTETGLSGQVWGGHILQQSGPTIFFSSSATYQNISVGVSDFPTTDSFTILPIGPVNGNIWYIPTPSSQQFGGFTSADKTLPVSVHFAKVTGYQFNLTEYSLPVQYPFSGSVTNNLNPNGITYYFNTTSNYQTFILPNGTWFLHVNETTDGVQTYVPQQNETTFVIAGYPYAVTVQFIDTTPGQTFLVNFVQNGLLKNYTYYLLFNGTSYTLNANNTTFTVSGIIPGAHNIGAQAAGYNYVGPTSILVESPGQTVYLNFTAMNNTTTTGQIGSLLAGIGISNANFMAVIVMGAGMFLGLFVYLKTEKVMLGGVPFVLVPFAFFGIGLVALWVPVLMILAYLGMFYLDQSYAGKGGTAL